MILTVFEYRDFEEDASCMLLQKFKHEIQSTKYATK